MDEREKRALSSDTQAIATEISTLLHEGRVLTSKDLDELGTRYNLRPRFISDNLGRFGRFLSTYPTRY